MSPRQLNLHLTDSTINNPVGSIYNVLISANMNFVPMDFIIMDIESHPLCPIILRSPFLRTVGGVIDMKEGNIKFKFPMRKGMEHFPRNRIRTPNDTFMRLNYPLEVVMVRLSHQSNNA